tara:strand:- start:1091 stop:2917 length:1827 start_codon:yes stop_codon:yes gene_type:complete
MSKNINRIFLFFLAIATILPKWVIGWIYLDNSIFVDTIFNVKDLQYFPIVKSFSEQTFNPSYLDHVRENSILSFPIYSILIHSLFFKIINVYSFIVLEFTFQFILLLVFFNIIKNIFDNFNYALYFCIFLFLITPILKILLIFDFHIYLKLLFNILDGNLGSRFPRPLFTGIIFFYFFYILFSFKENIEKFNLKYFIIVVFILSILLNSFFYYFINFSLLLIILFFKYSKDSFFEFVKKQKKYLIIIFFIFIFLSSPFLFQLYYGEPDYSERLGVIKIDFNQKIYLLKYYFLNLFRFETLLLLLSSFFTYYYINKKKHFHKNQISNINLFFYFVVASIFAPAIFFIFSPKLVSIYHFLGILLSSLVFYLIISLTLILSRNLFFKNNNILKITLIFSIFILNMYAAKDTHNKNYLLIKETQKIQNFLQNQNLIKTKKKLFTNDLKIMNLWLLNKNDQLVISDGFTNSLKNQDIELNFLQSLKFFGISVEELKNILSLGTSEIRSDLPILLYVYRYQANSLYTFSEITNYSSNLKKKIKNASPFKAQLQIMPEDEKRRLIKLYENIKLDKKLISDLVIINKRDNFQNFRIHNKKYNLVYSGNIYDIFQIN